jgi:hypothetical protein
MSKGIKGRGRTHSLSRGWEKALKKVSKAKHRREGKYEYTRLSNESKNVQHLVRKIDRETYD